MTPLDPTIPRLTRDLISVYDPKAEAERRRRENERRDAQDRASHARATQIHVFGDRIYESWRKNPDLRIEQVVASLLAEGSR